MSANDQVVRHNLSLEGASSCFLCQAVRSTPVQVPWYSRPIARSVGGAIALASLGALAPGHLLIAPVEHVFNTRSLGSDAREDLAQFAGRVLAALERKFGDVTVFEHGSCFDDHTHRSACTEHAHIQLVPGSFNLDPDLSTREAYGSLSDFLAADPGSEAPYLMLRNPGQPFCVFPDPGISQYVRRLIASALGEPDDWDYGVFPRTANVKATAKMALDLVATGASGTR